MKQKLLGGMSAAILTLSALTVPSAAAPRTVPVTVDGAALSAMCYVEDGVTSAPLRALLTAAGDWYVDWDGRNVIAISDETLLTVLPGEQTFAVNGEGKGALSGVYLLDGSTYVPIRALCESLGWEVEWDAARGRASVSTGRAVSSAPGNSTNSANGSAANSANGSASNGSAANSKPQNRPAAPVEPEVPDTGKPEGASWTEEDLYWLSRIISAESQGEPYLGQLAVGHVVLNRVASDEFPDTIKEVIFDARDAIQFEPVENGTVYDPPTAQSVKAAKAVLSGEESVVGESLYFYAPALSQGLWINQNRTYYTTIGCHRFYL